MSKISMSLTNPSSDIKHAFFLHKELGVSVFAAKKSLLNGRLGVFFTAELFLNDHVSVSEIIKNIVEYFNSKGVELYVVEVASDVDWEGSIKDENRISTDVLLNIIEGSKDRYS